MRAEHVPTALIPGGRVSVYSGTLAGVTSPIQNYTPFIFSQMELDAGATLRETIPGDYTTFIYVLKGRVSVGEENVVVSGDQVGWFERSDNLKEDLQLDTLENGTQLVLYAAQPQKHEIVSHGPFIADSMDEIKNLYAAYRRGTIQHVKELSEHQKIIYENVVVN
jgi:redox-sensitive bicupin YhaK (pirin superfamily)